jgi:hypothetical protein
MTGHFDEGSKGGGCGLGGAGFLTTFMPWITCAQCLVAIDWALEENLYVCHGLYLVKQHPPGCVGTIKENLKNQQPGFHFDWVYLDGHERKLVLERDWTPGRPFRT